MTVTSSSATQTFETDRSGSQTDATAGARIRTATQATSETAGKAHTRDHRVDALRGIALLMMFVDHMPQNLLNRFTLRNLGFADAAEIFVLLAGYASWLAYGRGFAKNGANVTLIRIAKRCGRLYLAQTLMLIVCVVTIRTWRNYSPVPVDFLEPELAHGFDSFWRVMVLDALPSNLNILPLYMVLLAAFPLIYLLIRANRFLALALSMALWALINIDPGINFPNWLDPDGWYFDPLAWQFLFVLGASGAIEASRHNGDLPSFTWLKALCGLYLTFSLIEAFPWAQWDLPTLTPFALPSPDKSTLAPLRLLDVMAIFYLVQSSTLARRFAETRFGQALALCGRHSLEVFTVGTILDLFGRLIFTTFGDAWLLQITINIAGLAILYGVTVVYERKRNRDRARARAAA
ncbi:OpgC family protein [Acetobacter fallax]|uniref:OpgC domain-containing protein n=1 Tax=Acetobacter fallax TaxID=1737473 RepID=A0ABX0K9P9_9PROT|nr:OpgC domain-containing protein [Acetobacter fallax]NHO33142.1 OpgC domain-containing protein [Acetobacter fallax]NHO36837.1 OpgC domain-containing protein [Acetobacter fallax]